MLFDVSKGVLKKAMLKARARARNHDKTNETHETSKLITFLCESNGYSSL